MSRRGREEFEEGDEEGSEDGDTPATGDGSDYSTDDDTMGAGHKKRMKKRKKTTLLDIEAEEDDMEDDEDEEGDELREFTTAHEGEEDASESAARAAMRLERMKRNEILRGDDHQELERYVRERYGGEDEDYRGEEEEGAVVDQNSLAPTVRDPRLFMVKCKKPGHEKKAIISLLQKHFDYARRNVDLGIFSAVSPEHLKGTIYVEAHSADTVKAALMGLELFNTYKAPMPVPLDEMIDVMSVGKRAEKLKKGNWVRINRLGVYKGDLAQVYSVREGGNENQVMVRLIPRLDLKGDRDDAFDRDDDEHELHVETSRKGRPPQKLFDKNEIFRTFNHHEIYTQRDRHSGEMFESFRGELFKHGLLYKRVSVKTLVTGDKVMPRVDELEKFQMAERRMKMKIALERGEDDPEVENGLGLDVNALAGRRNIKFFKGDAVRVMKGEQKGLTGIVEGLANDMVTVRVPDLPEPILTSRFDLVKDFKVGEHVKVATGTYAGTAGVIVKVANAFVTLFTDSTKEEIRVLSSNIVESSELAAESQTGYNASVPYEVFDLVELQSGRFEVGVVTKVQEGVITILDTHNNVRRVALKDIKSKTAAKHSRALDQRGNPIAPNDHVNVTWGPMRDRHGIVVHIAGGKIFFKARDEVRNCGLLVTEAKNCIASTAAARKLTATLSTYNNRGYDRPNSIRRPASVMRGDQFRTNAAHPATIPAGTMSALSRSGGNKVGGLQAMGQKAPKDILYKRYVTIKSGPFKGYKGRVKDANEQTVRVELDSKMKTISVKRSQVVVPDKGANPKGISGSTREVGSPRERHFSRRGAETPAHPMGLFGPHTPAHYPYMPGTPARNYNTPGYSHNFGRDMRTPLRAPGTPSAGTAGRGTPGHVGGTSAFNVQTQNPYSAPYRHDPATPALYGAQAGTGSFSRSADPTTPMMDPRTPLVQSEAKTPLPQGAAQGEDIPQGNIGGMQRKPVSGGGEIPQTPAPTTPAPGTPAPTTPAPMTPAPATPFTPAPMTPAPATPFTPAPVSNLQSGEATVQENGQAVVEDEAAGMGYDVLLDVVVLVKSRNDRLGVVQEASADGSRIIVRMLDTNETLSAGDDLQPMQPRLDSMSEREKIKILGGKHKGKTGVLMNTTESENETQGIVDLDGLGIQMVDITLIAKRYDDSK